MRANVQYNDYTGTTAADRCDLFCELPDQMCQTIFDWFDIGLDGVDYLFVGISVYTTKVESAHVTLFFENQETKNLVKVVRSNVSFQTILNLFKRFEFQVGLHLEDIDEAQVEELEE